MFSAPSQNGKPAPFCSQCDFFKWGATGAVVHFSNGEGSTQYEDIIGLGWWIAGDIPTSGQLPTFGSASYAGHTIGTVLQRVSTEGLPQWQSHIGAGNVELSWDFQARCGEFGISDFNAPSSNIGPLNATGTLRCQTTWLRRLETASMARYPVLSGKSAT